LERQGWKTDAPNEKRASHTVLMLRERFRELQRDPAVAKKPQEFVSLLREGDEKLARLENLLNAPGAARSADIAARWKDVQKNCAACHARFRDVPQDPVAR
jgi:hypothetical protein